MTILLIRYRDAKSISDSRPRSVYHNRLPRLGPVATFARLCKSLEADEPILSRACLRRLRGLGYGVTYKGRRGEPIDGTDGPRISFYRLVYRPQDADAALRRLRLYGFLVAKTPAREGGRR